MARRPTIVDVARKAGVAVSTASSALNGKGRVAPETRARVSRAARALHYRPDAGARGLVTRKTLSIGVRVGPGPEIPQAAFFVELLNGAATRAAEHGYALTITASELRQARLVDALISVDPLGVAEVQDALDEEIPVVTVGRVPTAKLGFPTVDTDHGRSIPTLLDHLAEAGHAGPVWLLSHADRPSFVRDIEAAFVAWCDEHDAERRVLAPADETAEVERVVDEMLKTSGRPAIVLSVLDRAAAWAQQALLAAGVGIPEQTVVAAASDGEVLRLARPAITALDLDGAAHGRAAVDLAIELIGGATPPTVLLPARLVVRGSSRNAST